MSSEAWAPGKLILCGEHAVVYGYPAIACAISRGTTVTLHSRPGPSGLGSSTVRDPRLWPALAMVLPAEGVEVDIRSDLPIGCGLGSSAALAVATIRALAHREGREPGFADLHTDAFPIERAFHGNPSGIDHAVSALGGAVWYRREGPEIRAVPLACPLHLVIANTAQPGNTAEMVAGVRARGCEAELGAIGALVPRVEAALVAGDLPAAGAQLDANHSLLQAIGVSTPALDKVVEAMRRAGAWGAKLAGAGGGGVAFALVAPGRAEAVSDAARALAAEVFTVTVGGPP